MLVAAVLTAVVSWVYYPRFQTLIPPSEELAAAVAAAGSSSRNPVPLSPEAEFDLNRLRITNLVLSFAVFGAVVGAIAGVLEGLCRRSFTGILLGAVAGVVLGAAFGGAGSLAADFVYAQPLEQLIALAKTMLVQGVLWGVFGLGIGAALAAPSRSMRVVALTMTGGLVGGVLAGVLYCFAWPFIFPAHPTELVVPLRNDHRGYWLAFHYGLIGLIAAWQGRSTPRPKR
jgi:hypothetical protein